MYKSRLSLFLGFFLILSACQPDPAAVVVNNTEVLSMLPADVMSVTRVNVPELLVKADFENFKKKAAYQNLIEKANEENSFFSTLLNDPAKSGIDLDQPIYLVNGMLEGKINRQYAGVIVNIKNETQFKTLIAESANERNIKQSDGLSMMNGKGGSVFWSAQHAFMGLGQNNLFQKIARKSMLGEWEDNAGGNSSLKKTIAKKHDIVSWTSSNPYAENKDAKMVLSVAGVDPDALKDNFIYSFIDFNDGEIVGRSEFDFQKQLTKDLDLFFKNKVNTNFSKYIPAEDLSMVFTAGLDVKGMNQVLSERPQSKRFITRGLKDLDLTTEDLARIIPGDLCLAFYNMGDADQNPHGVFVMPTEDEEGLFKLLDIAVQYGILQKEKSGRYILDEQLSNEFANNLNRTMPQKEVQLVVSNNMLAISSNLDLLDQIASGGIKKSKRLSGDQADLLSDNIFGGFVDLEELKLRNVKKSFPFSQIQFSSKREFGDIKLNFKNKNDNSLELLLDFLNELYLEDEMNFNVEI